MSDDMLDGEPIAVSSSTVDPTDASPAPESPDPDAQGQDLGAQVAAEFEKRRLASLSEELPVELPDTDPGMSDEEIAAQLAATGDAATDGGQGDAEGAAPGDPDAGPPFAPGKDVADDGAVNPPDPAEASSVVFGDRTFTPSEAAGVIQIHDWVRSLDEPSLNVIDALMAGHAAPIPVQHYQALYDQYGRLHPHIEAAINGQSSGPAPYAPQPSRLPAAGPASGAPAAPGSLGAPVADPWADALDGPADALDPRVAQELQAQREALARLEAEARNRAAQDRQAQIAAQNAVIADIDNQYVTSGRLSVEELASFKHKVGELGILASTVRQYPGDVRRAVEAAYETAFYMDPELRSRIIQPQVAEQAQVAAKDAARTSKAGALGGSGRASAPREAPAPAGSRAAMVADIRAYMEGGNS